MVVVHDVLPLVRVAAAGPHCRRIRSDAHARQVQPWSFLRPRCEFERGCAQGAGLIVARTSPTARICSLRMQSCSLSSPRWAVVLGRPLLPSRSPRARARGCGWQRSDPLGFAVVDLLMGGGVLLREQPAGPGGSRSYQVARQLATALVLATACSMRELHGSLPPWRHGGRSRPAPEPSWRPSCRRVQWRSRAVALARHAHVEGGVRTRHDGCDDRWLVTTAIFYMIVRVLARQSRRETHQPHRPGVRAGAAVLGWVVSRPGAASLKYVGIAIAKVAAYGVTAFATTSFATTRLYLRGRGGCCLPSPCLCRGRRRAGRSAGSEGWAAALRLVAGLVAVVVWLVRRSILRLLRDSAVGRAGRSVEARCWPELSGITIGRPAFREIGEAFMLTPWSTWDSGFDDLLSRTRQRRVGPVMFVARADASLSWAARHAGAPRSCACPYRASRVPTLCPVWPPRGAGASALGAAVDVLDAAE